MSPSSAPTLATTNSFALSSHRNAWLASLPRLISIPASCVAVPVASDANARILSSMRVFVVLTEVVVPLTVKLPVTVKSLS